MPDFLRAYWQAIRRWPLYAGLAALVLAAFVGAGLRGYRLLGDDNESVEAGHSGPGSRGGHGAFYHK